MAVPDLSAPTPLLARITDPADLKALTLFELDQLAGELRREIISVVSQTGGHLAPSLGVIELTLALLKVFNPMEDPLIWDVGHQAYAYKILTGRRDRFHTLRQMGGLSGFPKRSESQADRFGVGHSSTSISAALGMALGRDLKGRKNYVTAVIGDGSMTAGLAYEGLNQAGDMGRNLIVVLNDNEMSIARNVGAVSSFLSRNLSARRFMRFKREMEHFFKNIPGIGGDIAEMARKSEQSFKNFFTPGSLFEAFKFNYVGPIDGHDLDSLVEVFEQVRELDGPQLVHVLTKKGRGYPPAEQDPAYFHGVGCFEPETGEPAPKQSPYTCAYPTYTEVFGKALCRFAESDPKIVAITAAMPEGTGLSCFADRFPERFVDVGICEQHAVTFAAGLAVEGFKPVVAVYSTFLQRSYDQIVHDVCLQDLPVIFCLDRAGLVGEDGPTHHGAFDVSYLRHIPNLVLMAPKDESELVDMLATALSLKKPVAIRYPRGVGVGAAPNGGKPIPLGEAERLREGKDAAILALGSRVHPSLAAAEELFTESGLDCAVVNARFVKPLPEAAIRELLAGYDSIVLVEENTLQGGFSSAVLEFAVDNGLLRPGVAIKRLGLPDAFIEHGPAKALRRLAGVDKDAVKAAVRELVGV